MATRRPDPDQWRRSTNCPRTLIAIDPSQDETAWCALHLSDPTKRTATETLAASGLLSHPMKTDRELDPFLRYSDNLIRFFDGALHEDSMFWQPPIEVVVEDPYLTTKAERRGSLAQRWGSMFAAAAYQEARARGFAANLVPVRVWKAGYGGLLPARGRGRDAIADNTIDLARDLFPGHDFKTAGERDCALFGRWFHRLIIRGGGIR